MVAAAYWPWCRERRGTESLDLIQVGRSEEVRRRRAAVRILRKTIMSLVRSMLDDSSFGIVSVQGSVSPDLEC